MQCPDYNIKDINLAPEGEKKIMWAKAHMPVLSQIEREFIEKKPFDGLRISVSVHVEAKTAYLARVLQSGGAKVGLTGCNPLSTQDDVAAALAAGGMSVYGIHGADEATYIKHLRSALSMNPHIVIDDGGDFAMLLHTDEKERTKELLGGSEETTTGVIRLRSLMRDKRLLYPVIAVNDARSKHLFDNRYGTGQSVMTAIMATTNLLIAGKSVVVAGYGMCGKGVAKRADNLGARVIVTEVDAVCACEAVMDGYAVMTMDEAASVGDLFVTVTGCKDVLVRRHFEQMKDGAICCNAGHFDVEVNLNDLSKVASPIGEVRKNISGFRRSDGAMLYLLAEGRLVNLASGDGHPAEIMDMSFSLQALSAQYLAKHAKSLKRQVYMLPDEIDMRVSTMFLTAYGHGLDRLTQDQADYLCTWDL